MFGGRRGRCVGRGGGLVGGGVGGFVRGVRGGAGCGGLRLLRIGWWSFCRPVRFVLSCLVYLSGLREGLCFSRRLPQLEGLARGKGKQSVLVDQREDD